MDNHDHEREHPERERRNSNTEYIPTKCRITKPPPPKPATNPLQFVKVAPCPLFQKAQEQIKKVEEIKRERKEIREEVEDWQQNLDNWKSSRRKRQEHIIERVVEVKKLTEQEELERAKRKSKTFSEMMERNRGRHKFTIPVYDDDSNDLSDYGIGSSSSKTNSIKDVDTDDSSSILDEKEIHTYDSPSNRDSTSNQSQSEDETNVTKQEPPTSPTVNNNTSPKIYSSTYTTNLNTSTVKPNILAKPKLVYETKLYAETNSTKESTEQYTYEGAIQDYRSRIQTKIKVDESIFTKNREQSKSKEFSEAQTVLPKGEIFKRKGLFESEKSIQINHFESNSSRRLSEDFANSRSIKDRLKSLEKSADQSSKAVNKNDIQVSVKQRLQNFNKQNDFDKQNNNTTVKTSSPSKISNYLLDKSSSTPNFQTKKTSSWKNDSSDRCSSPETELYMNKLNMFNRDLDNLMNGKSPTDNNLMDYCTNSNYAPSVSSAELTGISSDREDSGIHTADVSCSVSQADEPIDTDTDIALNTIPSCIEKLNQENELTQFEKDLSQFEKELDQFRIDGKDKKESNNNSLEVASKEDISGDRQEITSPTYSREEILNTTEQFLESLKKDASENISAAKEAQTNTKEDPPMVPKETTIVEKVPPLKPKPAIYENIEFKPYNGAPDFITNDFLVDSPFSLTPPKMEPPKVKPPPPPPPEDDAPQPMKRMNSTKRIKKEMHIKRSSFLGLDEPTDDQIDPEIEKPPELNSFLQKESKLEKSLYKKLQEENRISGLSKVESQDSGLDIDRGRLSSDTWCSSVGDSSIPSHERQDSEQTNSITSEEDEITKKEREIIEMVEKEEQSRDTIEYVGQNLGKSSFLPGTESISSYEPSLGSDQFNSPYIPQPSSDFLADQDSEVLKVEQELRQLEREELERQRENLLFRESRAKARLQSNRHSLENICDEIYPCYPPDSTVDYRKSMPELQNVPLEYRKSVPDVPSYVYKKSIPDIDLQYRKSMPNIQHAYQKLSPDHHRIDRSMSIDSDLRVPLDHRKSMPELQHDMHHSAFKSPPPNRQPIMPGKPLRPVKDLSVFNPIVPPSLQHPNVKGTRQLSKHSLQALSAVPRSRHVPNDNWIQPKANPEAKNYNQHWVFQEAELRRISDQQKNVAANRNWQQPRHEKHLPDSIIQSLTQRVQNRTNINERNQQNRRSDGSLNKEYMQHPYLGHPQTVGHALPTMPYSPPLVLEESQDRILSVSGKKKCSYCGNELGRGAAMIIESLCLFYHMECFKCCVCHVQLGDGLMGTDVRVRNQKLHCHNCYSSDDGVKFSCV
uniref:LIM zinc-binding domain-containing protein n=1 Tax=Anoplophora glabripennis TaxID=217634 RepID=V5GIF7_ANOGL